MRRSVARSVLLVAMLAAASAPAAAQIPYTVFDDGTSVGSIAFDFVDTHTLSTSALETQIELSAPGALAGLRSTLSFLPFVPDVGPHPFGVLPLQRDVVRLRRYYEQNGFIGTTVRYEVTYDEEANEVAVTFVIDEGEAITLTAVEYETEDGRDPVTRLPESLADTWRAFVAGRDEGIGDRMTETVRRNQAARVTDWFRNRGYPFADVGGQVVVDTTAATATLRVVAEPGPRARIGEVQVQGNESVSRSVILRTFGVEPGSWYSAQAVSEGQRRLFALDLFRLVLADAPEDQQRDSVVSILVRIEESPPRLVTGELGYGSVGGVTVRGEFAHRNFTGGARSLRVDARAETGVLSVGEQAAQDYRLSVSYRRPFLFHPRLSMNVAPFGQYRDNITDRSWQAGVESSVIYELGPFRYLTFTHRYASREVLDFRLGSADPADFADIIERIRTGALDSLESRFQRSTFTLSATIGRWNPLDPTDALQARPSIEVTAPGGINTIEYLQLDLPLTGYLPLRQGFALSARARIGRVFPYGNTFDGDSIGTLEVNRLRDVVLTAGGTGSVRGWGNGLLGAKFPDLRIQDIEDGDSLALEARGWTPEGGLARALGSVELSMPFPGLGEKWGTHAFLDAGRVWTPGDRVPIGDEESERWFFGAGLGFDYSTLAGPLRISIGYKLNPSPLDVRDAQDVLNALLEDRPITSAPADWKRRIHIHLSIGGAN